MVCHRKKNGSSRTQNKRFKIYSGESYAIIIIVKPADIPISSRINWANIWAPDEKKRVRAVNM